MIEIDKSKKPMVFKKTNATREYKGGVMVLAKCDPENLDHVVLDITNGNDFYYDMIICIDKDGVLVRDELLPRMVGLGLCKVCERYDRLNKCYRFGFDTSWIDHFIDAIIELLNQ